MVFDLEACPRSYGIDQGREVAALELHGPAAPHANEMVAVPGGRGGVTTAPVRQMQAPEGAEVREDVEGAVHRGEADLRAFSSCVFAYSGRVEPPLGLGDNAEHRTSLPGQLAATSL